MVSETASEANSRNALAAESPRLRVLLVCHELNPGAPSIPLHCLSRLPDVEVFTIAFAGGDFAKQYATLGPLAIVPSHPSAFGARVLRRIRVSLLEWRIRQFAPDVVYVNSVASLELVRHLNIPTDRTLLHVHELESYVDEALIEQPVQLVQQPKSWIAVSDAVATSLKNVGIPSEKISVVPACIPDESAARTKPCRSNRAKFVIGGAGNGSWRKGIVLWLQTAAAIRKLNPTWNFEFRWVGMTNNVEGRAIPVLIRKLGLEDVVTLIPRTTEPYPHYEEFDLFLMSSWEDSCPIVVIENMSLETPVLCFAGSGGAPHQVAGTGIVVPEFDCQTMARRIIDLAANPERMKSLGRAARERVRTNYLVSIQAPKLKHELQLVAGWRLAAKRRPEKRVMMTPVSSPISN